MLVERSIFNNSERQQATLLSKIAWCNPFDGERKLLEKELLNNKNFESINDDMGTEISSDLVFICHICEKLLVSALKLIAKRSIRISKKDEQLYCDLVYFHLYHQLITDLDQIFHRGLTSSGKPSAKKAYSKFSELYDRFAPSNSRVRLPYSKSHLFACFYQIRRSFLYIFQNIIGSSNVIQTLRARVWQSIFTCDMKRYQRSLYNRMGSITTLITGPTGSGKELVARAIGLSRFIPFDSQSKSFVVNQDGVFFPVNLSALSSTLIESELFGHISGAFTGAIKDRKGYFEASGEFGSVFLDEVGEIDEDIQVKLLRVLQSRTFQRLGDTKQLSFNGKVIAATHRDIAHLLKNGKFRHDFYYRLCSDKVTTPSLREILNDKPAQLDESVIYLANKFVGEDESAKLAEEVIYVINNQLGRDYSWPGNYRELEQCVRNVMIQGIYDPERAENEIDYLEKAREGKLNLMQLSSKYTNQIYQQTKNFEETARRLEVDRRTVKKYVDFAKSL